MNDMNVKTNFENIPFIGTLLTQDIVRSDEHMYEVEWDAVEYRADVAPELWEVHADECGDEVRVYKHATLDVRARWWKDSETGKWLFDIQMPLLDPHTDQLSLIGEHVRRNIVHDEANTEAQCRRAVDKQFGIACREVVSHIVHGAQLTEQTLINYGTTSLECLECYIARRLPDSLFGQMVRSKRCIERLRRTIIGERKHMDACDLGILEYIDNRLRCYLLHADMEELTEAARRAVSQIVSRITDVVELDVAPAAALPLALESALIPLSYGGHQG